MTPKVAFNPDALSWKQGQSKGDFSHVAISRNTRRDSRNECLSPAFSTDSKYVNFPVQSWWPRDQCIKWTFCVPATRGSMLLLLTWEKRSQLFRAKLTDSAPSFPHSLPDGDTWSGAVNTSYFNQDLPNMTLKLTSNLHLPENSTESQRCSIARSFGQSVSGCYTVKTQLNICLSYDDNKQSESLEALVCPVKPRVTDRFLSPPIFRFCWTNSLVEDHFYCQCILTHLEKCSKACIWNAVSNPDRTLGNCLISFSWSLFVGQR